MADEVERLTQVRRMCITGEARRRRLDARLSVNELAAACGVSGLTVHRWETGSRRPRRDAALRYLNVLEKIARVAA